MRENGNLQRAKLFEISENVQKAELSDIPKIFQIFEDFVLCRKSGHFLGKIWDMKTTTYYGLQLEQKTSLLKRQNK